jgi:hypothetical protein
MKSLVTALSGLIFFTSSVSGAYAAQKEFHKTFQVTPGGRLIVRSDCCYPINMRTSGGNIRIFGVE